jgi:hypothetical protein
MKGIILVPALGIAALAFSSQAHAQRLSLPEVARPSYAAEAALPASADATQPYYESRRLAYENGYRDGVKEGEKDGRKRDVYRYEDNRTWQRGDKGYNRSFGDIERYRQQFRVGFAEGYQAGYSRYAQAGGYYGNGRAVPRQDPYRYPGGYGYPDRRYPEPYYGNQGPYISPGYGYSPAYSNGVTDGIEKGREDARKRRAYDPRRHDWYRDGDRHYRNEYGSRQQYENLYRQGFQEGYDRGYRDIGYIR